VKLRLYHKPLQALGVFALAATAIAGGAVLSTGSLRPWLWGGAGIYALVTVAIAILALRIALREGQLEVSAPERLLLVAPHQDDCVLMAGTWALRNLALGGRTEIVYLVQPTAPETARIRRQEAENAWTLAGLPKQCMHHLSSLPAEGPVTWRHLEALRVDLQAVVDAFQPTVVFTPLFEGGHLHHDLAAHVVTHMLRLPAGVRVYQAPEYSPYLSFWNTPHAALSYVTRLASFGLVAYYSLPEGVGEGPILNLRVTRRELEMKRGMLRAFASQSGAALAQHHGFADRLIQWQPRPPRARPFRYEGSRPWLAERLARLFPPSMVRRLLPGEPCTIGLPAGITNLDLLPKEDVAKPAREPMRGRPAKYGRAGRAAGGKG
jgi:LmbE family N-acetylglucosaminyl deacetylase